MLLCGRDGAGGARSGRVSRRYIRIKPRMSDRPIHAWGSCFECSSSSVNPEPGFVEDEEDSSSLIIPTTPGSVGVTGGLLAFDCSSILAPSGITGPGRALKGLASSCISERS